MSLNLLKFFPQKSLILKKSQKLWCEEGIGIAGGNFNTLVYMGVLKCEYIIHFGAEPAGFYESNAAVIEQNVLAAAIVIDTVDACQFFVQLELEGNSIFGTQVLKKWI